MSDFKTIETQEELDRIIKERLARQKEQFADYDQLKERVSTLELENATLKTTIEESNQTVSDYESKMKEYESTIEGYETSKMKTTVALSHGLPIDFADRLQGDDEASLVADAERFASLMKQQTPIPPLKDIEPKLDDADASWRQVLKDLKREGE